MTMGAADRPPLADTAARLARLDPYAGFEIAPALDPRWCVLDRAEPDGTLDAWLALLLARHGHRATAGSRLGGVLTRAVVQPAVSAMVLEQRCTEPSAANVAARLDDAGDLARAAVLRPTVAVLVGDIAAQDRHSIVMHDLPALVSWWAGQTYTTLAPLLSAVRARAPFGLPALWGAVADEVTSVALWVGQLAGRNPYQIWDLSQLMVEALAAHASVRLARSRPFPVAHPTGQRWFQIRGTCCLSYRSIQAEGPEADRYCSNCPLRDNESRRRHLYDYLTELSSAAFPSPAR